MLGQWGTPQPLFSSPGLLRKMGIQLQSYHSSGMVAGEQWNIVGLSAPLSDLGGLKPHIIEVFQLYL